MIKTQEHDDNQHDKISMIPYIDLYDGYDVNSDENED